MITEKPVFKQKRGYWKKILTEDFLFNEYYIKQNCKEENLITVCNACNSRVNNNREYWYKYYKEKRC